MKRLLLLILFATSCSPPHLEGTPLCGDDEVDAPSASPPDAAPPDAYVVDLSAAWPWHVVYKASLTGADGGHFGDPDGDGLPDLAVSWEEAGVVTLSFNPGPALVEQPWPTVELGRDPDGNGPLHGIGAVEGTIIADVDGDTRQDLVAASESQRIFVFFAPTCTGCDAAQLRTAMLDSSQWTMTPIDAADAVTHWMAVVQADFDNDSVPDIGAGGKAYPGQQLAYFTSPTPRVSSSWTRHFVGNAGWVMTLIARDANLDGRVDMLVSDRTYFGPTNAKNGTLTGARWVENGVSGWTNHTIDRPVMHGDPKMMSADGNHVIDCASDSTRNFTTRWDTTNWITWTPTTIPIPASVGQCQHVAEADMNLDGHLDLVWSYAFADDTKSAVVVLLSDGAGGWTRWEASGLLNGSKADNVLIMDADSDGDPDIFVQFAEPGHEGSGYLENLTVP